MITIGVIGEAWRAVVTPWGAVRPDDRRGTLDWYVMAEDRWHVPSREPTVRQRRIDGTAVVETRLKIPGGDAVHRVFAAAESGGMTVVEVENESPQAIVVAFDRGDLLTERPIGSTPIVGLELPAGSFALPVGHRSRVRLAWSHRRPGPGPLPTGLPDHQQVVNGWRLLIERASRFSIPATTFMDDVVALRCELLLGTWPDTDPAGLVIALEQSARLGEPAGRWVPEVAAAVESLAGDRSWTTDAALAAAERFMRRCDERRAADDVRRIIERRRADDGDGDRLPSEPPIGVERIAWLERSMVREGAILPDGFGGRWLGVDLEVHDIPLGGGPHTISFAVRWHGERPAVLWEQTVAQRITAPVVAPGWSSDDRIGEALWPAPG